MASVHQPSALYAGPARLPWQDPGPEEGAGDGVARLRGGWAGRWVGQLARVSQQPLIWPWWLCSVRQLSPSHPWPPVTSGLSGDMTATGRGSLAPVRVSTLDSLGVHWPEIMPPMRVGGQNI